MAMVQQAVEHGGDGSAVTKQFSPVFHGAVRGHQGAGASVTAHDDLQSYELLAKFGVYVKDACDKCGQILGAKRYTRAGDSGVWCSQECRGDEQRNPIRKGGRPRKYKTETARQRAEQVQNAERQRCFRARFQRNGKPPRVFSETKNLQARKMPLSQYPLTPPISVPEKPSVGLGGEPLP